MAAQDFNVGLGTPTARYEGSSQLIGGILLLLLILGIGGLFLIPTTNYRTGGRATEPFMLIFGIIFILTGFIIFYFVSFRNSGLYVQTYSDGLVRVKGSKVETVRWDEIVSVWQKVVHLQRYGQTVSTQYTYTLQTDDKRKLKFSNEIKDIAGLGHTIVQRTTDYQLPKVRQAYDNGETVTFGSFSVNKQGVKQGRKSLEWAEIEGAQISRGYVTFKKQGKWLNWAKVPAAKIPNLVTFLTLIDQVIGVSQR